MHSSWSLSVSNFDAETALAVFKCVISRSEIPDGSKKHNGGCGLAQSLQIGRNDELSHDLPAGSHNHDHCHERGGDKTIEDRGPSSFVGATFNARISLTTNPRTLLIAAKASSGVRSAVKVEILSIHGLSASFGHRFSLGRAEAAPSPALGLSVDGLGLY
jgi:hypothetical protein